MWCSTRQARGFDYHREDSPVLPQKKKVLVSDNLLESFKQAIGKFSLQFFKSFESFYRVCMYYEPILIEIGQLAPNLAPAFNVFPVDYLP